MACATATTRRSLLAITGATALLPVPAHATSVASPWADLIASIARTHPNAPAALLRAMDLGVDPRTFCGITLRSPGVSDAEHPALFFGDRKKAYHVVTPRSASLYTVFH